MKYKTLTQNETDNCLLQIKELISDIKQLQKYKDSIVYIRKKEFYEKYSARYRKFNDITNFEDCWTNCQLLDGYYRFYGPFWVKTLKKLTPYNKQELEILRINYDKVLTKYNELLIKWGQFAQQPFEMNESDINLYFEVLNDKVKYNKMYMGL